MRHVSRHGLSAGFTLVELMVAMVIGLITVVIIGQVMAVAEGQKRTATSGSDAAVNSALALFTVERDVKGAGYGLVASMGGLGCDIHAQFGDAKNFGSSPTLPFPTYLVPVMITDGAGGAPDSIQVLSSNKNGLTLPTTLTDDHPATAANFFVESDLGIQEGDLMIAVPATLTGSNWCSVFQVTGDGGSGGGGGGGGGGKGINQVIHNSGLSEWNQPGGSNIFPPGGYQTGDHLINLGQMIQRNYAIADNNLTLTEFNTLAGELKPAEDLYPQIVQMQAVYGKDVNNDCVVDTWEVTQPTNSAEWQQIRAVRMALVARSQVMEKTVVTLSEADVPAGQRCNTASPHGALVCWRPNPADPTSGVAINLNVGAASPNWQRYRYRVYETAIPVRNMVWLQKTSNTLCEP